MPISTKRPPLRLKLSSCMAIGSYHKTSVRRFLDTTRLKPAPLTNGVHARSVSIARELSAYRVEVAYAE